MISRRCPRQLLAAVVLAGWLSGCGGPTRAALPAFGTEPVVGQIEVTRRDITSVVTIEATVVASPSVTFVTPEAGTVRVRSVAGHVAGIDVVSRSGESLPVAHGERIGELRPVVGDGTEVPKGLPVVIAVHHGFAIQGQIPGDRLYRLLGGLGATKGAIDHGPGPFSCPIIGAPSALGLQGALTAPVEGPPSAGGPPASPVLNTGAVVTCGVPDELTVLPGSPAVMAIETGTVRSALSLPVEAVAGMAQTGRVAVVSPVGAVELRSVGLGLTDGRYIEIVSGLAGGERVLASAPTLPS